MNDSVDYDNVTVANVEFDMDRFIDDSNVSLHYVNLIVNSDNGKSVEINCLILALNCL